MLGGRGVLEAETFNASQREEKVREEGTGRGTRWDSKRIRGEPTVCRRGTRLERDQGSRTVRTQDQRPKAKDERVQTLDRVLTLPDDSRRVRGRYRSEIYMGKLVVNSKRPYLPR